MKKVDYEKIKQFEDENPIFVKNNLIQMFLEEPKNRLLYEQAISNPNPENNEKIDKAFKAFYLKIRFISHISSTLFYNSINYDKRNRLLNSRFSLILDVPLNKDEPTTYADLLIDNQIIENTLDLMDGSLKKMVMNERLYNALDTLTENQLAILNLAYVELLNDTEIARRLNKTQQAISKTHKLALKKIADNMNQVKGG